MSKRTDYLMQQLRTLYASTREAQKQRNALRDDYVTLLAEAEATLAALRDERDEALVRLNALLLADGQEEITLDYFKGMP